MTRDDSEVPAERDDGAPTHPPATPVRTFLRAFLVAALLGFLLTLIYIALR